MSTEMDQRGFTGSADPGGKINNVFEVPGNFTTGTLVISGRTKLSGNVTVRTKSARSIPVTIR